MQENREVKSDVFSMLLEDKKNALEVYNALNGTDYDNPEDVEIVTLEKGISLSIRNDASFIVDTDLNIYEHQSTYNPNMPLRALFYVSSMLKERTKGDDLYGRKRILIPVPRFVVIYNGRDKRPPVEYLKLSDMFEKRTDLPEMEIICTVYNINPGCNDELLSNCPVMYGYMALIGRIRENIKAGDELPIKHAIEYCIEHDILRDFLLKRGLEVEKNMAIDMTWETREKMIRRDEFKYGFEDGYAKGNTEGKAIAIIELLEELGEVPMDLKERIRQESDLERLSFLLKKAAKATSIEDFSNECFNINIV